MLILEGVTRKFGQMPAVSDVSLEFRAGSFVGVIGRSGAGKSTLLRLINRLIDPTAGRVSFKGTDVTRLRGAELRAWRARAAMIFQQFNLVGRLDADQYADGRLAAVPTWRALNQWTEEGQGDRAPRSSNSMSRPSRPSARTSSRRSQQRVAIARALVQEPEIILADEPVASLDPRNTQVVMDALLRINRHFGITVICNLHSLDLARSYCDRLIGIAAGRVVFDGAPAQLTDQLARELYGLEAGEVVDAPRSLEDIRIPALGEAAAA